MLDQKVYKHFQVVRQQPFSQFFRQIITQRHASSVYKANGAARTFVQKVDFIERGARFSQVTEPVVDRTIGRGRQSRNQSAGPHRRRRHSSWRLEFRCSGAEETTVKTTPRSTPDDLVIRVKSSARSVICRYKVRVCKDQVPVVTPELSRVPYIPALSCNRN